MTILLVSDSNSTLLLLAALLVGYAFGSVPFGLVLGKLTGLGDIRKSGSGNIGATNMLRVGGKKLAAITLLLDALKGTIPVLLFKLAGQDYGVVAAIGALTGHLFPVWLKFKGGKGVATAIGIWFGLAWPVGLAICAAWLLSAVVFRYSSLAALLALGLSPIFAMKWATPDHALFALLVGIVIWVKHHANIKRLLNGSEPKIGQDKK